jgi:diaminohydroxyphosphoribosylaminopyrimidine deaminase/5-amino-6-(5-phosphoribosylamino)uracil reductase
MRDSISDIDRQFLDRAVRLAMNGRGAVEPNPMVGCVWVKGGRIIGEGFHQRFGGLHAEPNALAACDESAMSATAYVTLEPCCHTNKKTPPCVPVLVAAEIARVVVGCLDPNPQVSGRGVSQLREAGIRVDEADDPACRQLIAPFIARIVNRRPYITLKWAQSADGKVAGPGGRRVQISGKRAQHITHELRARSDAILVGIGTARNDDPLLTARDITPARPLIRCVLDSDLRFSIDSQLVRTIDRGRLAIFCSKEAADYSGTRVPLAACGVEIHPVPSDSPGRLNLPRIVEQIGRLGATHLIVEPGPTLARSFFDAGLWDRAWVVRSDKVIGDSTAPDAVEEPPNAVISAKLDEDVLTEYLNPRGVYAGAFPSADFVLSNDSR